MSGDRAPVSHLYGWTRLALAAGLVMRPKFARPWLGPVATNPDAAGALRMLAVRDGLLGAAVLLTGDGTRPRQLALRLCVVADVADALVSARDAVRTRRFGAALAAVSAAGGAGMGALAISTEGNP